MRGKIDPSWRRRVVGSFIATVDSREFQWRRFFISNSIGGIVEFVNRGAVVEQPWRRLRQRKILRMAGNGSEF